MEKLYCSGDIYLNNPLSLQAAHDVYKKLKNTPLDRWAGCILDAVDDDCITIPKTLDDTIYGYIDTLLIALDNNDYIASGELECRDNDEDHRGTYVIENNKWTYYDADDIWQVRASDSELIEVLENRGYKVIKEGK